MKAFVYILFMMATLALGDDRPADQITGRVVAVSRGNMTVQYEDGTGGYKFDLTNYKGDRPKIGDIVTVWVVRHFKTPDVVTKIEVKAAGASKK
jgi:hypothetical protein